MHRLPSEESGSPGWPSHPPLLPLAHMEDRSPRASTRDPSAATSAIHSIKTPTPSTASTSSPSTASSPLPSPPASTPPMSSPSLPQAPSLTSLLFMSQSVSCPASCAATAMVPWWPMVQIVLLPALLEPFHLFIRTEVWPAEPAQAS